MDRLRIEDLTQEVEIFYFVDGKPESRVFVLREHSRRELDEFIDLQMAAGRALEEAARNTEISSENASEIVRLSMHLRHDPFYGVVSYCLRFPKDGGEPPSEEWCREHVARRKAEAVIQAQERLDGLDDPEKKSEAIRAVMLASHHSRTVLAGLPSTTELPTATD